MVDVMAVCIMTLGLVAVLSLWVILFAIIFRAVGE